MKKAIKFLRGIEWYMGCGGASNEGQCDFCCGVSKEWTKHSSWQKNYGHKRDCELAIALEDLGLKVDYVKEY